MITGIFFSGVLLNNHIMAYQCKSPVLFLIFNRPEVTARVFEAIRLARPAELYIAADGPRADRAGEAEICQEVRRIATAVDWDCEVKTCFRDQNLGCGKAISEAITWFFENVEEGIILEDDCLPHISFFEYCDRMLQRYLNDDSIWSIAGTKFRCYPYSRSLLGYKSEILFCWGWACWRNRWKYYTRDLNELLPIESFGSAVASRYWERVIASLNNSRVDSWGYRFALLSIKKSKKNIVPPCNLVRNLGFGESSTHTKVIPRHYSDAVFPVVYEKRSTLRDAGFFDNIYYGLHHQQWLVRSTYILLMCSVDFYEKIFDSIYPKE